MAIGLTIVFAVSGVALNHIEQWNPNYIVKRYEQHFVAEPDLTDEALTQQLLSHFAITHPVKATYWGSPTQFKLFFTGGGSLTLNFLQQRAVYEQIRSRPVFKEFNHLHLNEAKYGWIVFSDIYALILLFLAISALFMVKGKYSPWRLRSGSLVILGGLIPLIYIFLL